MEFEREIEMTVLDNSLLLTREYSGTSNNGHSEERTTSLQRTICVSPADNRMHSIHFYLRDTDTSNLRITDKPDGHPAYKITSDNGQRTLRTRGNAEKCIRAVQAHSTEPRASINRLSAIRRGPGLRPYAHAHNIALRVYSN